MQKVVQTGLVKLYLQHIVLGYSWDSITLLINIIIKLNVCLPKWKFVELILEYILSYGVLLQLMYNINNLGSQIIQ